MWVLLFGCLPPWFFSHPHRVSWSLSILLLPRFFFATFLPSPSVCVWRSIVVGATTTTLLAGWLAGVKSGFLFTLFINFQHESQFIWASFRLTVGSWSPLSLALFFLLTVVENDAATQFLWGKRAEHWGKSDHWMLKIDLKNKAKFWCFFKFEIFK